MGEVSSDSSSESPPAPKEEYADYSFRESGGLAKFVNILGATTALTVIGLVAVKTRKSKKKE